MKNLLSIFLFILGLTSLKSQEKYGNFIKDSNKVIKIIALDSLVSEEKLQTTSSFINGFFGFKTIIDTDNIKISDYLIQGSDSIDVDIFTNTLWKDTLTLYLTNHSLYSYIAQDVSGATTKDHNISLIHNYSDEMYFTNLMVHELGHSLGLHHCENEYCVMSESDNYLFNYRFCSKCISSLYYK